MDWSILATEENINLLAQLLVPVVMTVATGLFYRFTGIKATETQRDTLTLAAQRAAYWAIANRKSLDSLPEMLEYVKRGAPDIIKKYGLDSTNRDHLIKLVQAEYQKAKMNGAPPANPITLMDEDERRRLAGM